jgi:hypothetical protein
MSSPAMLQQILPFAGTSTEFRVSPIMPRAAFRDLFLVVEANAQTVALCKTGVNETVHIPTDRIIEILDSNPNVPRVLVLNGRLQHVTEKWQWLFFEDKPDTNSELGFVKRSNPQDPIVLDLTERLKGRLEFRWGAVDELSIYRQKGYVAFYDGEGYCFVAPDRYRDTILLAKRK